MNKLTAFTSALSTLAIGCFVTLGTGCIVEEASESDSWDDADTADVHIGSDEEALEAASPAPSKGALRGCMCACGNGVTYGPMGDGVGCMATCQNYFYNHNIVGCTNPCGGGYPVEYK